MNLGTLLAMLKSLVPVLLPLGESGINQLFQLIDAEIAKIPKTNDASEILPIVSVAAKQIVLMEFRKLAK